MPRFLDNIIGGNGRVAPYQRVWFVCCAIFVLFGLGLRVNLQAAMPAILMDKQLSQSKVYLKAIKDRSVYYYDKQGRIHKQSIDQFVHIQSTVKKSMYIPEGVGIIEFVDGQQVLGKLSEYKGKIKEGFYWECYIGGKWDNSKRVGKLDKSKPTISDFHLGVIKKIPVSLNEVSRISFTGKLFTEKSDEVDIIKLRNGEVVRGYLMDIVDQSFEFQLADQELTIKIAFDQVEAINLISSQVENKQYEYAVLLNDGSRVLASGISINDDLMTMTLCLTGQGTDEITIPVGAVKEISNLSSGYRLQYLAKMDCQIDEPSVVFGKSYRLKISKHDILMHAPLKLRYQLPDGAVKMSALVEMDQQDNLPQLSKWADMNLILRKVKLKKAYPFHLNSKNEKHEFTIDLIGERELVVELDPGINGPVLDRMIMRNAVLLIKEPELKASMHSSSFKQ